MRKGNVIKFNSKIIDFNFQEILTQVNFFSVNFAKHSLEKFFLVNRSQHRERKGGGEEEEEHDNDDNEEDHEEEEN